MNKGDKQISSLRTYFHSIDDSERAEVIDALGMMVEQDAIRELIQLYHDCEWRESRLQIIRVISKNSTQRGLEFLFKLALNKNDLPVAEAAIWSLGQSHQRLAAQFLINYYDHCAEVLKPSIAGALGQIPDRTLGKRFVNELPKALENQEFTLARNIILTLGELKMVEILPTLLPIAKDHIIPDLAVCALVSIGKLARDHKTIETLEHSFQNDLFYYQIFTSTKTHVRFRSQWKLEDYLKKLFEDAAFHKSMPFELNHFAGADVKEGIKLFLSHPTAQNFERVCLALGCLDFDDISEWYTDLFNLKSLHLSQLKLVLRSIAQHRNPKMVEVLSSIRKNRSEFWNELLPAWLEAYLSNATHIDSELKSIFDSAEFKSLAENIRISAINPIYYYGLTVQFNAAPMASVTKILELVLENDPSHSVKARVLRALGGLKISSKKAVAYIKSGDGLLPSCYQFLEACPQPSLNSTLLSQSKNKFDDSTQIAYLKCLTAFAELPIDASLDAFLKKCLHEDASLESKLNSLLLLRSHPREALFGSVIDCLKANDERVQLGAIITLKSMATDKNAETIANALNDFVHSKKASLSGRALDTLTGIPGLRAKRIVIDYLKDHADQNSVCDKVIRCLKPPETYSDYFPKVINQILEKYPQHEQKDGLIFLREKMFAVQQNTIGGASVALKGIDTQTIDKTLTDKIMGYPEYDEAVKSALRSAEVPYLKRELFDEFVDKSSSIVEYCKAVDMLLEKKLGKKILFPKLESNLQPFENVLYMVGLNEDYPNGERVLHDMGLEKHFNTYTFPLHKIAMIAQGIRKGKIVNEQFKTLDGLRAWAIMLLLFGRKYNSVKPLISLKSESDEQVIAFCKHLMSLQDIRNPLAHRQTEVSFVKLDEVRAGVFSLLSTFNKII